MEKDNNLAGLLIANSKNIIAGILVLLSLVGGIYGSFKEEEDGKEAYSILAPDVDMAIEQSDINSEIIRELETRIIKLEAERSLLELMPSCWSQATNRAENLPAPRPLRKKLKEVSEPSLDDNYKLKAPTQHSRRKRKAPSWEQKMAE